jgi:hypothetical protein
MVEPRPHQAASQVRTHCLSDGRYSRNTAVSRIKLPPPPNPTMAMKNASDCQLGAAPAAIPDIEQMNNETLKAKRLPMMSALNPQKRALISIPT